MAVNEKEGNVKAIVDPVERASLRLPFPQERVGLPCTVKFSHTCALSLPLT